MLDREFTINIRNKPYHDKYMKMRYGNIKIRKVILVDMIEDDEYEFENTIQASIWYKEHTKSLATISNLTNMMVRVAKGDRKHLGNYYVYIEGINM